MQYFDWTNQEKSLDQARVELMSEVRKLFQRFLLKSLIQNGELSKETLKVFIFLVPSLHIFEATIVSFGVSYIIKHYLNLVEKTDTNKDRKYKYLK